MGRCRGKAIAFGLVALLGATTTSISQAADGSSGSSPTGDSLTPSPRPLATTSLATLSSAVSDAAAFRPGDLAAAAVRSFSRHSGVSTGASLTGLGTSPPGTPLLGANVFGTARRFPAVGLASPPGATSGSLAGPGATSMVRPAFSPALSANLAAVGLNARLELQGSGPAAPAEPGPAPAGPPAPASTPFANHNEPAGGPEPEETLGAAAHTSQMEAVFQARPDAPDAIAASSPQYVVRPNVPGAPSAASLARLRQCESGGNYGAISSGGWYRGAYQFDYSTWNSVASRWLPHLVGADPATAAPDDQDLLASALYTERGWQPWPTCGLRL